MNFAQVPWRAAVVTALGFGACTLAGMSAGSGATPGSPPVIPIIDASMKARLQTILAAGAARKPPNRPSVFAKAGDSITESASFLFDVGCNVYVLGVYSSLRPTITYYRNTTFAYPSQAWCGGLENSFDRSSLAAVGGWTTDDVLGTTPACAAPNNDYLRCEYSKIQPAIALIMFGTNDLDRSPNPAHFENNLATIVTQTLAMGVIPVLSTIPPRLDSPAKNALVGPYNQAIAHVAASDQIPLWNYWLALYGLGSRYNYGMSGDGVHPSVYQGSNASIFTAAGLEYGYNVRNLTAIQVLDKIKRIVIDNGPPG
jgi:lysophospholipase L1-like esterase